MLKGEPSCQLVLLLISGQPDVEGVRGRARVCACVCMGTDKKLDVALGDIATSAGVYLHNFFNSFPLQL